MNIFKNLRLIVISLLLVVGVTACEDKGPAEKAGEKIDQTVEKTSDVVVEATDAIVEATDAVVDAADAVVDAISDTDITTQVKAAIYNTETLKSLEISVNTMDGVVTLNGAVASEEQRELAETTAAAVTGVNSVNNELEINTNE